MDDTTTAIKRYYWLRLQDKFFEKKALRKLRRVAGGDTYTIIYLKLQLLSIPTGGILTFEGVEDTFGAELALVLDEEVDNINFTLIFLEKYGLIERLNDKEFLLPEAAANIGTESGSAARMRKLRSSRKTEASQCDGNVTLQLQAGDAENNRIKYKITNNNNDGNAIVVGLEKIGLSKAATREIVATIDKPTALSLLNYAQTNNLGPGWLLTAARDPSRRPPPPTSEAAIAQKKENPKKTKPPDPDCPICHEQGGWGAEVDSDTIGKKMQWQVCDCVSR